MPGSIAENQLREELLALAERLGVRLADAQAEQIDIISPDRLIIARAWAHAIRRRNEAFGGELFSDPAWDMLLDLYIAHFSSRGSYVSALCVASNVPQTTALRWISTLEKDGYIYRRADELDGRRVQVALTDKGLRKMEAALDRAIESDRNLGIGRMRVC